MARIIAYILNLIFLVLIGWILNRVLRQIFGAPANPRRQASAGPARQVIEGQTARDPICGTFVSTEVSHRLARGNETLHFCSRECLEKYQKM